MAHHVQVILGKIISEFLTGNYDGQKYDVPKGKLSTKNSTYRKTILSE